MIENNEIERLLEKLENLEDEVLAVEFLTEFNHASSALGKLLLNLDNNLTHSEWKILCDNAQKRLDKIIKNINEY